MSKGTRSKFFHSTIGEPNKLDNNKLPTERNVLQHLLFLKTTELAGNCADIYFIFRIIIAAATATAAAAAAAAATIMYALCMYG
jgi:hypothetical protein